MHPYCVSPEWLGEGRGSEVDEVEPSVLFPRGSMEQCNRAGKTYFHYQCSLWLNRIQQAFAISLGGLRAVALYNRLCIEGFLMVFFPINARCLQSCRCCLMAPCDVLWYFYKISCFSEYFPGNVDEPLCLPINLILCSWNNDVWLKKSLICHPPIMEKVYTYRFTPICSFIKMGWTSVDNNP